VHISDKCVENFAGKPKKNLAKVSDKEDPSS
jgi:hypothetical protein